LLEKREEACSSKEGGGMDAAAAASAVVTAIVACTPRQRVASALFVAFLFITVFYLGRFTVRHAVNGSSGSKSSAVGHLGSIGMGLSAAQRALRSVHPPIETRGTDSTNMRAAGDQPTSGHA
jgi:hypothetical protein